MLLLPCHATCHAIHHACSLNLQLTYGRSTVLPYYRTMYYRAVVIEALALATAVAR
eukprot:COSAG01_NODE_6782_length_3501_cov_2.333627_5_plen_56_part_00